MTIPILTYSLKAVPVRCVRAPQSRLKGLLKEPCAPARDSTSSVPIPLIKTTKLETLSSQSKDSLSHVHEQKANKRKAKANLPIAVN